MSQDITLIVQFKIHDGKQEEWKAIYDEGMEDVAANDPDVLSFTLYINDDESVFTSYEVYRTSEAILMNFKLAEDRINRILAASDVISVEVFGDVSNEVRDLLTPFGTNFFNYDRGYTR